MARKIEVALVGDSRSLERAFGRSSSAGSRWGSRLKSAGRVAGLGIAAGVGLAAIALKKSVDAAKESELAQSRMQTQLKASGISWKRNRQQIEDAIKSHSKLAAIDDEEVQDSMTNLIRTTGSVTKAIKLNALAMDVARAKNMDLETASRLIGKVAAGNTSALSRYGIVLEEGATKQEALAELQKRFAGQAKAYGDSTEGAQDRFAVALENVQEKIGAKLLPALTKLFEWGTQFMEWSETNWPRFQEIIHNAVDRVRPIFQRLVAYWNGTLLPTIQNIIQIARRFWNRFGDDIQLVFGEIKHIIQTALKVAQGIIETTMAVIRGDWREAWGKLKETVREILGGVKTLLLNFPARILGLVLDIGKAIAQGILDGLGDLAGALAEKLKGALSDALDSVKGAFGIGSPSKVFAEQVGVPISQGITEGILSGARGVRGALASTAMGASPGATAPARSSRGATPGGGYPGGPVLIMTDQATATWLQGLNRRYAIANGGRGIL